MTSDFLRFAHALADESRALLRRRFRSGLRVDAKADASPVTAADREVEALLRERIRAAFPDHGILGEEHGGEDLDAEHVWVLDPIDGTRSFATGRPLFGTLIGLVQRGSPVLGLIDSPVTGERWSAADGCGAELDGRPVRVRAARPLHEAALYASPPHVFAGLAEGLDAEGDGQPEVREDGCVERVERDQIDLVAHAECSEPGVEHPASRVLADGVDRRIEQVRAAGERVRVATRAVQALDDEDPLACLREERSRRETAKAAADDDAVREGADPPCLSGVRDPEPDADRQRLGAAETGHRVRQLVRHVVPRAGDAEPADEVDETAPVRSDLLHPLVRRRGRDQPDKGQRSCA